MTNEIISEFPIIPGQVILKKEVHKLVGGSDQHAMTSCQNKSAFLIFHDPVTSKKNRYDLWEGEQADGTFSYTGQGLVGDQKLTMSNRGLVFAAENGQPIHFFVRPPLGVKRDKGNPYTYVGQVALEPPYFEVKVAPDTNGEERNVFVFRLIPLGQVVPLEVATGQVLTGVDCNFDSWKPVQVFASPSGVPKAPSQAELEENKLQNRFGTYMENQGEKPERVAIKVVGAKGSLFPDFILRNRKLVVEAKPSVSREHVRLAVGQVLDYQHLLAMNKQTFLPAILLPSCPQPDLVALIKSLGITLIIECEDGKFDFIDAAGV